MNHLTLVCLERGIPASFVERAFASCPSLRRLRDYSCYFPRAVSTHSSPVSAMRHVWTDSELFSTSSASTPLIDVMRGWGYARTLVMETTMEQDDERTCRLAGKQVETMSDDPTALLVRLRGCVLTTARECEPYEEHRDMGRYLPQSVPSSLVPLAMSMHRQAWAAVHELDRTLKPLFDELDRRAEDVGVVFCGVSGTSLLEHGGGDEWGASVRTFALARRSRQLHGERDTRPFSIHNIGALCLWASGASGRGESALWRGAPPCHPASVGEALTLGLEAQPAFLRAVLNTPIGLFSVIVYVRGRGLLANPVLQVRTFAALLARGHRCSVFALDVDPEEMEDLLVDPGWGRSSAAPRVKRALDGAIRTYGGQWLDLGGGAQHSTFPPHAGAEDIATGVEYRTSPPILEAAAAAPSHEQAEPLWERLSAEWGTEYVRHAMRCFPHATDFIGVTFFNTEPPTPFSTHGWPVGIPNPILGSALHPDSRKQGLGRSVTGELRYRGMRVERLTRSGRLTMITLQISTPFFGMRPSRSRR